MLYAGEVEAARRELREAERLWSGVPGVIIVLFRPPFKQLQNNPRFMVIAQRFELIDYWRTSGKWPDFCFRPDLPYDCKVEAAKVVA